VCLTIAQVPSLACLSGMTKNWSLYRQDAVTKWPQPPNIRAAL
jgi:hypothetical protein